MLIFKFFVVNTNFARIFARIFTKMSPYEELVTLGSLFWLPGVPSGSLSQSLGVGRQCYYMEARLDDLVPYERQRLVNMKESQTEQYLEKCLKALKFLVYV